MNDKRVTTILYGADRRLWRGGPLQIRISDVFASGGPSLIYRGDTEESTVEFALQLPFDSNQVYGLTFSAPGHHPAWQLIWRQDFIRGEEPVERDDIVLRLMLVPKAPGTSDLPHGFDRLTQAASPLVAPGRGVDTAQFGGLEPAAQMALLNIEAKLRESAVGGRSLLSFVRAVRHVAVDRLFLCFDASLKALLASARDFAGAPGHGVPKAYPELPAHPDSWKHTRFPEGNIQLSFSAEPIALSGDAGALVHSADVDIDLGRGIAHAAEWLENNVVTPGHKTSQVLVYGLLYAQNILPCYTLDAAPATTSRGLTRLVKVTRREKPVKKATRKASPRAKPRRASRRK